MSNYGSSAANHRLPSSSGALPSASLSGQLSPRGGARAAAAVDALALRLEARENAGSTFSSLLSEVRRKRASNGVPLLPATVLALSQPGTPASMASAHSTSPFRPDLALPGNTSGGGGGANWAAAQPDGSPSLPVTRAASTSTSLMSMSALLPPALLAGSNASGSLGRKRPNYEAMVLADLVLLSYQREPPTQRMQEVLAKLLAVVASHEEQLSYIFNFYGQLGKVVWLDDKLTMNEKQFHKLAIETGVSEGLGDEIKELFRRMSDKVEYSGEAASNHPTDFLYFDVFPEACIRLAALRYEWRPPENMEDAEEEIYFASAPFMPLGQRGTPRASQAGGEAAAPAPGAASDCPSRPPEQALYDLVTTYVRDDLLAKARRFKTAGSVVAKNRAVQRTAPKGKWLSGQALNSGV